MNLEIWLARTFLLNCKHFTAEIDSYLQWWVFNEDGIGRNAGLHDFHIKQEANLLLSNQTLPGENVIIQCWPYYKCHMQQTTLQHQDDDLGVTLIQQEHFLHILLSRWLQSTDINTTIKWMKWKIKTNYPWEQYYFDDLLNNKYKCYFALSI